ncbi:hypothetical protein [Streptomyces sp. NRRL F-5122]|uniref:hypothetical protein n=1 Tax=Streptomyces sp. NRRL F-5122 TaxID=1609098 RepID=UPI0018FEFB18|nr:hypothetical protein [Streptomyces sp. NRRL F-5122]
MHLGIAILVGLPLGAPAIVPPQCFEEASGFGHSLPHFLGPALVEGCCGDAATAAWVKACCGDHGEEHGCLLWFQARASVCFPFRHFLSAH